MQPVNATHDQSRQSQKFLNALFLLTVSLVLFGFFMGYGLDFISLLKIERFFSEKDGPAYESGQVLLNLIAAFLVVGTSMVAKTRAALSEQVARDNAKRSVYETGQAGDPVTRVVSNLDIRISRLLRNSEVIYWTIIISLIAGVFLIIFAGSLSAWDTRLGSVTSHIESLRSDVRPYRYVEETNQRIYDDYQVATIKRLDDLYDKVVQATIDQAKARPEGRSDWNWPSTILRIGVIGMLVFLTQILISLYRYNYRLIAFYSSRREALILADRQSLKADVERLASMLLPSNFDFGREPRHPLQEMMGFLRGARNPDDDTAQRKRNRPKVSADEPRQRNANSDRSKSPLERPEASRDPSPAEGSHDVGRAL
jgi:hypothetical protein